METIRLRLTGTRALLMHNCRLADPRNPVARAIKELTRNRQKTDSTYEEIEKLEWLGSLYQDDEGRVVVTEDMILGAGINGAKKMKAGPAMKAAVLGTQPFYPLIYDGPREALELYESGKFIDYRGVVVQRNRTMRARPRFNDWSVEAELMVDEEQINVKDVVRAYELAGRMHGLGDFRPRFGRFEVEQL